MQTCVRNIFCQPCLFCGLFDLKIKTFLNTGKDVSLYNEASKPQKLMTGMKENRQRERRTRRNREKKEEKR